MNIVGVVVVGVGVGVGVGVVGLLLPLIIDYVSSCLCFLVFYI